MFTCRLAAQILTNRAEFPSGTCVTTILRPTLVERQSVRCIGDTLQANAEA
jgi:hypothetical protein